MPATFESSVPGALRPAVLMRWLPLLAGALALYVPTYVTLANGAWNEEHNSHGPIVLLVIVWLFWRLRDDIAALKEEGALLAGWALMACGLAIYVVGRALEFVYLDAFSQVPVATGAILVLYGWRGVRLLWFPLLYILFLVPLPGVIMDAATGALKQMVSVVSENLLYNMGYPITRSGVILAIGQYRMLVADACSGINSMYMLSALGTLFVYLTHHNWIKTAVVICSIWPIAFVANIMRVIVLVLITYYLGDEAGQGFLHDFSGILLFGLALGMMVGLHAALDFFGRRFSPQAGGGK